MKSSISAILFIFSSLAVSIEGFQATVSTPRAFRAVLSSSASDDETVIPNILSRRDVVGKASAVSLAGIVGLASNAIPALADGEEEGKLIEFQVDNLGGEAGATGKFVVKTHPEWAPNGVKRFEKLTEVGFWDNCRIFRVLPGFIGQFGINGNPSTQALWRSNIPDDQVKVGNKRGTVVFATAGPNTRTTQIFVNTGNNNFLDKQGFSPIGEVVEGMDVVDKFYAGYGEGAPQGKGPNQGLIQAKGNEYLEKSFPKLTYFSKVTFQ
jgi:peptidyl-prolyl cis-trans isomerase A (cyclophilin A)